MYSQLGPGPARKHPLPPRPARTRTIYYACRIRTVRQFSRTAAQQIDRQREWHLHAARAFDSMGAEGQRSESRGRSGDNSIRLLIGRSQFKPAHESSPSKRKVAAVRGVLRLAASNITDVRSFEFPFARAESAVGDVPNALASSAAQCLGRFLLKPVANSPLILDRYVDNYANIRVTFKE